MASNKREKQLYEDLKEQLSKLNRSLKNFEAEASKQSFAAFEGYKDFIKSRNSWKRSELDEDHGLERLERALEILSETQEQKKTREPRSDVSSKGKKRKTKKSIDLHKLASEISSYKTLIDEISAQTIPVSEALNNGNGSLAEGRLQGTKADRMRQELDALSSRWNVLHADVSNTCRSLEAFALEVQLEYSKASLWFDNSEALESWLTEYEPHAKQPERLGTTIRAVRNQLHENQRVCEEVRGFSSRFENMSSSADGLIGSGRLDEADVEEVDQTRDLLFTRWETLNSTLAIQRNRIYAEINKLRKRIMQKRNSLFRRFSSRRKKSSFRKKRGVDAVSSLAIVSVPGDGKSTVSEDIASTSAPTSMPALETVLLTPNDESEQDKGGLQNDVFQNFDVSLKSCEKSVHDLEEESLLNFSAVGSSVEEVKKQLDDITRFEDDLTNARHEIESVADKFEKAKEQGLLKDGDKEVIDKRVSDLKSRWNELQREHIVNKRRIIQALVTYGGQWMGKISKNLDEVEKQVNMTEVHPDDPPSLEENIAKQKGLLKQLDLYDAEVNKISNVVNDLVRRNVMDEETSTTIQKDTLTLQERLNHLKNACREKEEKLSMSLSMFNQRTPTPPPEEKEEVIKISEDFFVLSQYPDDIPSDEGFAELDGSKSFLDTKMVDFSRNVESMNQWMGDTEKLVNSLHVRMAPQEVSKRIQEIKIRCGDLEKNEAKMKHINKVGQEITAEALQGTTSESVENELAAVNKRWRDTKEMLEDYSDKDNASASQSYDCCLSKVFTRMRHACFYS